MIANSDKLHNFNPLEEVIIKTDASLYGVGAQVCNRDKEGNLKTVSCASATLT